MFVSDVVSIFQFLMDIHRCESLSLVIEFYILYIAVIATFFFYHCIFTIFFFVYLVSKNFTSTMIIPYLIFKVFIGFMRNALNVCYCFPFIVTASFTFWHENILHLQCRSVGIYLRLHRRFDLEQNNNHYDYVIHLFVLVDFAVF